MKGYYKPVNSCAAAPAATEVSLWALEHGIEKTDINEKGQEQSQSHRES